MTTLSALVRTADAHFFVANSAVPAGHFLIHARHGQHSALYLMAGTRSQARLIARIENDEHRRVYLGHFLAGTRRGGYLYGLRSRYQHEVDMFRAVIAAAISAGIHPSAHAATA